MPRPKLENFPNAFDAEAILRVKKIQRSWKGDEKARKIVGISASTSTAPPQPTVTPRLGDAGPSQCATPSATLER
ncbi:hypothetical protein RUM44_012398 [Polyplax serrata]|uniref:Uncharacterized protein n=1 Tax=Polyplax serrata TaxID=468196 RepID=A0ABR1BEZ2_POLSC